jgi:hypothetical protein
MSFVDTARKMFVDTPNNQRNIEAMAATPKAWQELMDQQGISSIRQLAKIAGLPDHTRINAVIMNGSTTSTENMEKVARALKVPVEELYKITSGVAARPMSMPAGTEKLSERAKNAVAEIIRVLIEEEERAENVDKKSDGPTERAQEKTGTVTPIGGRGHGPRLTPAQERFNVIERKVAKTRRDFPQDTPKENQGSPNTDE